METMHIELLSVVPADQTGRTRVRARVVAPRVGARIWIELQFKATHKNAWDEAYQRTLQLLDIR